MLALVPMQWPPPRICGTITMSVGVVRRTGRAHTPFTCYLQWDAQTWFPMQRQRAHSPWKKKKQRIRNRKKKGKSPATSGTNKIKFCRTAKFSRRNALCVSGVSVFRVDDDADFLVEIRANASCSVLCKLFEMQNTKPFRRQPVDFCRHSA